MPTVSDRLPTLASPPHQPLSAPVSSWLGDTLFGLSEAVPPDLDAFGETFSSFEHNTCLGDGALLFDPIVYDPAGSPPLAPEYPTSFSSSLAATTDVSQTGYSAESSSDSQAGALPINIARRLQDLNRELAVQLQSYSDPDLGNVLRHCENMLALATRDCTEFILLLKALRTEREEAERRHVAVPYDSVQVLNLISVHLQLLTLYKSVFQLLPHFCHDPSLRGAQTVLGMSLEAAQACVLKAQLIVHAVLRQLETIERVLGLPSRLCVTDKTDFPPGLLTDIRTARIVDGVFGSDAVEQSTELQTIYSLREALSAVQASLEI